MKRANTFFLNFEDFSIFKLRSAVFLIQFPLTFTQAIVPLWVKMLPVVTKKTEDEMSRYDAEQISLTKHAIKEFVQNLQQHLLHLQEYMQQVMEEKPLEEKFNEILKRDEFINFRATFFANKNCGLSPENADEFFKRTFAKMQDSFDKTLENMVVQLGEKVAEVKAINLRSH